MSMVRRIRLMAAAVALLLPMIAAAQTQVKTKTAPAKPTSTASGEEMYKEYCASCHGLMGKGDGPAAPALKTPPADLATLSSSNGGQFPEAKVIQAIKGGPQIPAHGSAEMPVWGRVFLAMRTSPNDAQVQLRARNLAEYIKTLQTK
jgi:mono/diheme cytochrome c family protein